jgi:hypothetical protein
MRAFAVVIAVKLDQTSQLYKAYKADVMDAYNSMSPLATHMLHSA